MVSPVVTARLGKLWTSDRGVAGNEVLFRQVNEHVVAGGRRPAENFEILCECADTSCMDHVSVTTESYERPLSAFFKAREKRR